MYSIFSEALRERGYSVSFILSSQSPVLDTIRERGFPYATMPVIGDLDPRIAWDVAMALRSFKPDLVNINDSPAIVPCCLGARLAGIPLITTVHAFHQKWGFLPAGHLLTVSEALRRHMLAQGFHRRPGDHRPQRSRYQKIPAVRPPAGTAGVSTA